MGKIVIETFLFGLRIELALETEFDAVDSARSKVDFIRFEFELEIGSLSVVADLLDGLPSLEQMTNGDGVTGCVCSLLSTKSVIGMSWVSCLENFTLKANEYNSLIMYSLIFVLKPFVKKVNHLYLDCL